MQQPPKKKVLLTPKRTIEVADSLGKKATFERQTADLMGKSMESSIKSGKKTDYLGRTSKENSEAIVRHLDKADIFDANAKRYRRLAEAARKVKNK